MDKDDVSAMKPPHPEVFLHASMCVSLICGFSHSKVMENRVEKKIVKNSEDGWKSDSKNTVL